MSGSATPNLIHAFAQHFDGVLHGDFLRGIRRQLAGFHFDEE